jgi:quercetin dioxygenase-like cupin family protein
LTEPVTHRRNYGGDNVNPIVKAAGELPDPLKIVNEEITILSSNTETKDYELFLQEGPEGSGPPPHYHDWDESFYVLEGNIDFGYNDQTLVARQGTLVHLPAGTVHWFRFAKGGGKMLSVTGKNSNASTFFTQLAREIPSGKPELDKLIKVAQKNGVDFKIG